MKGRLEKRSKSSWTIVIEAGRDPSTGRRKRVYLAVQGTKTQAKQEMDRLLSELRNGTYVKPDKTTLAEYLRQWLETYCRPKLAPSTIAGYASALEKHVIPSIGRLSLKDVHPMHLQTLYSDLLAKGLAPRMVQLVHVILHEALGHAVRWQMLTRNPGDAVEPPKPRRSAVHALSVDEVEKLLSGLAGHRDYVLIYLALQTGMRRGELLALKWSDLDLEKGGIVVDEGLVRTDAGLEFAQPKTQRSRRTVPIAKAVCEVLRVHRRSQLQERLKAGSDWNHGDLVFSNRSGRPQDPSTVSSRFGYRVKRIGLPGTRFHDLRHTHASLLLQAGVNPKIVQERLGHESISTTMDVYSHVIPTLQEEAARKVDDLIGRRFGDDRGEKKNPREIAVGDKTC